MSEQSSSDDDFPLLSLSTPQVLTLCLSLSEHPTLPTVFVTSYPKSGTTWMQAIVYNLLSDGKQSFDHISNYFPFFEIQRTWDLSQNKLNSIYDTRYEELQARAFNTHLRFDMMPKAAKMKYIYVFRNGKDVALSFYHHLSNQDDADNFTGSLGDFLKDWTNGKVIFGSWLRHLEEWTKVQRDPIYNSSVLFVKYEHLLQDLPLQIHRISQFLGLAHNLDRIQELSQYVTFSYMKEHSVQFSPSSVPWKVGFEFIRKGQAGGSKSEFTEEDHKVFEEMVRISYPDGVPEWLQELDVLS